MVISPATAATRDVFADVADFALQDAPIGTGDAVRAALRGRAGRRRGRPRAQRRRAADRSPSCSAPCSPSAAPPSAAVAIADAWRPTIRARSGASSATATGEVSASSRPRTPPTDELEIDEINAGIYAFDAAWLRRRHRRPAAVAGDRRAVPDRAGRAWPARTAAGAPRSSSRTTGALLGINDRVAAGRGRGRPAGRINERHLLAGVTMQDPSTAYVEPSVELAEDVTLEAERPSSAAGRGSGRARRSGPARRSSTRSSAGTAGSGPACIEARSSRTRSGSGRSPTSGPAARSAAGCKLGNFAEVKNTPPRRGRPAAPLELPRRRRRRRPDATSGAGTITANYDGTAQAPHDDRRAAPSSASTRCSSRRSRSATGRRPAPARS